MGIWKDTYGFLVGSGAADTVPIDPPNGKKTVTLNVEDDCFERARKVCMVAGLKESQLPALMAESFAAYMKMDEQMARRRVLEELLSSAGKKTKRGGKP